MKTLLSVSTLTLSLLASGLVSASDEQAKQLGVAKANKHTLEQCYNKVDSKYAKALFTVIEDLDYLSSRLNIDTTLDSIELLRFTTYEEYLNLNTAESYDTWMNRALLYGKTEAQTKDSLSALYKSVNNDGVAFCDAVSDEVLNSDNIIF